MLALIAWGGRAGRLRRCSCWRPGLMNLATTQAHTQGSELAHPNFYPIYDLPVCMKELVMQNHSSRLSMTLGNSRTSKRSFGKGPVLTV